MIYLKILQLIKNILFTCANPTKIIILVIEMLDLIKKKSIYNKS